jgi:hypothetical protein
MILGSQPTVGGHERVHPTRADDNQRSGTVEHVELGILEPFDEFSVQPRTASRLTRRLRSSLVRPHRLHAIGDTPQESPVLYHHEHPGLLEHRSRRLDGRVEQRPDR